MLSNHRCEWLCSGVSDAHTRKASLKLIRHLIWCVFDNCYSSEFTQTLSRTEKISNPACTNQRVNLFQVPGAKLHVETKKCRARATYYKSYALATKRKKPKLNCWLARCSNKDSFGNNQSPPRTTIIIFSIWPISWKTQSCNFFNMSRQVKALYWKCRVTVLLYQKIVTFIFHLHELWHPRGTVTAWHNLVYSSSLVSLDYRQLCPWFK